MLTIKILFLIKSPKKTILLVSKHHLQFLLFKKTLNFDQKKFIYLKKIIRNKNISFQIPIIRTSHKPVHNHFLARWLLLSIVLNLLVNDCFMHVHDVVSIRCTNCAILEYNKSFQWQYRTVLIYNLEIAINKQTSKDYMCWDLFLEDAPLFSYATTKSLEFGVVTYGRFECIWYVLYQASREKILLLFPALCTGSSHTNLLAKGASHNPWPKAP